MDIDGAEAPEGVELMDFDDFDKHRQLIFSKAKESFEKQFPKEYNGVRMELSDVDYIDKDDYTLAEQKKALHDDKFLRRRLRGTITLKDANTGEELDKKTTTLMGVPWLTDRGTFIRGGNEWGTISQQRLIPGAYSRYQKNGDLETQFNVRPGTGGAFRVAFNPESSQYKFATGGANLHLYSLMHDMGVSDDTLRDMWGDEVFESNAEKYDARVLDKAYAKIVPDWMRQKEGNLSRDEKAKKIKEALDKAQMSSFVAKSTLPNLFSREKAAAWKRGESDR